MRGAVWRCALQQGCSTDIHPIVAAADNQSVNILYTVIPTIFAFGFKGQPGWLTSTFEQIDLVRVLKKQNGNHPGGRGAVWARGKQGAAVMWATFILEQAATHQYHLKPPIPSRPSKTLKQANSCNASINQSRLDWIKL